MPETYLVQDVRYKDEDLNPYSACLIQQSVRWDSAGGGWIKDPRSLRIIEPLGNYFTLRNKAAEFNRTTISEQIAKQIGLPWNLEPGPKNLDSAIVIVSFHDSLPKQEDLEKLSKKWLLLTIDRDESEFSTTEIEQLFSAINEAIIPFTKQGKKEKDLRKAGWTPLGPAEKKFGNRG